MPQAVESQAATRIVETAPPEESAEHAVPEGEDASGTNRFESASVPELASAVAELTAGWSNSEDSGTHETGQKKDSELAATAAALGKLATDSRNRRLRHQRESGTGEGLRGRKSSCRRTRIRRHGGLPRAQKRVRRKALPQIPLTKLRTSRA